MTNVSFEFFPPKSYLGFLKLLETQKRLSVFDPSFVSVTQSDSNTKDQLDVVVASSKFFTVVAPHMLCRISERETSNWLNSYSRIGIDQLVTIRGDKESYHRQDYCDVGNIITSVRTEHGGNFVLDVSAYPDSHPKSISETSNAKSFTAKTKSGINSTITQYFYNLDSFFSEMFRIHRLGVRTTVTPGIMNITSWSQLARMTKLCGSDVPLWITKRLQILKDNEILTREFSAELTIQLCESLVNCGVNDLHFYTLNDHKITSETCRIVNNEVFSIAK